MLFAVTRGKPELVGDGLAIDGVRDAGEGATAERQLVHDGHGVEEAVQIAIEHLHVGEHVMREEHRLGALEVRVAGHDGVGVLLGEVDQRGLQRDEVDGGASRRLDDVEAEVGSDLVVAGAGGVELAGERADLLCEAGLDVHVDVFELRLEDECAVLELVEDLVEAPFDLAGFGGGDDVLAREHAGVGNRRLDVLGEEHGVGVDGGGVGLDELVGGLVEAAGPGLRCRFGCGFRCPLGGGLCGGLRGGARYGGAGSVFASTAFALRRTYRFSHFPS